MLITPPMILESSALHTPRVSKLKPGDPPSFYARLLVTAEGAKTPAWKDLEQEIEDLGIQHFGEKEFGVLTRTGSFRSPIRIDVAGRGWPEAVIAFVNLKSGGDYLPSVVGADALPIMSPNDVYPGCIVRASVRMFAYGGKEPAMALASPLASTICRN